MDGGSGRDEYGLRRDQRRRVRHHIAVDTGEDDSIVAFDAREQVFGQVRQGARVRMVVTPRLGYVRSIEVLSAPRPSAVGAPTVQHELVRETTQQAGSKLADSMRAATAGLEAATDDQGRALLDQTDDEGVALRDRIAESTDRLEQLRHDPRLRRSPLGGLLDAFLAPGTEEPSDGPGEHPDGSSNPPDTDNTV